MQEIGSFRIQRPVAPKDLVTLDINTTDVADSWYFQDQKLLLMDLVNQELNYVLQD